MKEINHKGRHMICNNKKQNHPSCVFETFTPSEGSQVQKQDSHLDVANPDKIGVIYKAFELTGGGEFGLQMLSKSFERPTLPCFSHVAAVARMS